MEKRILTIAIPTFNRAGYLNLCLESIISQIDSSNFNDIEVIVCNNASTDDTGEVVKEYKKRFNISYFENEINLGGDNNIAKCFDKATGKYVWVFGDDDIVLSGKLKLIINLLKNRDVGVLKLEAVSYMNNINEIKNVELLGDLSYKQYDDPIMFMERVHYWITFISGIIVNKDLISSKHLDYYEFINTNLVQLNWSISSVFEGKPNIIIETPCIGCKADNTGGYKLITVFSQNYNRVLNNMVRSGRGDKRVVDITNRNLISDFFPHHLTKILKGGNAFDDESGFFILTKTFWYYKSFWRRIIPMYLRQILK